MTSSFKKISRCWAPRKLSLAKHRPQPSLFSFAVCFSVALSFACGFSGGYISALAAPKRDYGSIYQGLLEELENSKLCIEKEKLALRSLKEAHLIRASLQGIALARTAKSCEKEAERPVSQIPLASSKQDT